MAVKLMRIHEKEIIAIVREKYKLDDKARIRASADFHVWGEDAEIEIEDIYVDVAIYSSDLDSIDPAGPGFDTGFCREGCQSFAASADCTAYNAEDGACLASLCDPLRKCDYCKEEE